MFQSIKRQFRVQWRDWIWAEVAVLGAALAGVGLFLIMTRVLDDTDGGYFGLGTLLSLVVGAIFSAMMTGGQMMVSFQTQIAMGSTRKQFFVSYYIVCLVESLVLMVWLLGIAAAENILATEVFGGEQEIDFVPYLLRYGFLAVVGLNSLGALSGTMILRFGKKAFWTLWILWMIAFLGIPRVHILAKGAPDSIWAKMEGILRSAFGGLQINTWIVLGGLLSLIFLGISWISLRRQQVNV